MGSVKILKQARGVQHTNECEVLKKFIQELIVWVGSEIKDTIFWVQIQVVWLASWDMWSLCIMLLGMYILVCCKLLNCLMNDRHVDC